MSRIELLKKYLDASPDDCFLRHALALEYIGEGDDEEAEVLFRQVLDADPLYVGSYYHLGKLLERRADTKAAMDIYRKGVMAAGHCGDFHAKSELQSALEELGGNGG